jgi:hypothetical protein
MQNLQLMWMAWTHAYVRCSCVGEETLALGPPPPPKNSGYKTYLKGRYVCLSGGKGAFLYFQLTVSLYLSREQ